ncbi:hypothetical protein HUT06_09695 [Actinomadura sp. NAK00032]|uniref:hypothetical protein n=1 Tax=Actinomadura sp. NAK00032 TaxID=2742128 RepID=UPI001592927C|nr:hypothetical protein [Actinomadura sp. NAK00032]QKW34268.1 hypothetical protein HUT06_09695 [Actinomadura sp. NAK00032]
MRIRALTALVATVLASVVPLSPAQAGRTPDDQPLPGYTIDNPPLPPVQVHAKPTRVPQGVHHHAAYAIEVPPHWNGKLALYAHGYAGTTSAPVC